MVHILPWLRPGKRSPRFCIGAMREFFSFDSGVHQLRPVFPPQFATSMSIWWLHVGFVLLNNYVLFCGSSAFICASWEYNRLLGQKNGYGMNQVCKRVNVFSCGTRYKFMYVCFSIIALGSGPFCDLNMPVHFTSIYLSLSTSSTACPAIARFYH